MERTPGCCALITLPNIQDRAELTRSTSTRETPLNGLVIIQRHPHEDDRGFFDNLFDEDLVESLSPGFRVAQVNRSVTRLRGTLRGMHYQASPHADTKIVTCTQGRVFDVVVDIRRGSPTFLRWHGQLLEHGDFKSLVIPAGFAHGFQALVDHSELIYLHGSAYYPDAEAGLNPLDPVLDITWPEPPILVSERDAAHELLADDWNGVVQ